MSVNVKLAYLYAPIKKDIQRFEDCLASTLRSRFSDIQPVLNDVLASKGKRLRPALLFFSFYAALGQQKPTDKQHQNIIKLAVAIELLHMASLVHDDIIDGAEVRHNRPSVYATWGQNIGVVLGVHLYSLSLQLIAEIGNITVLEKVSQTVRAMCEGEMVQVLERKNANLSLPRYLTILKKKTGVLFGLACECGYLVGGDTVEKTHEQRHQQELVLQARGLKNFGLNLGVVYQIVDDYLDITGDEKTLGKKPGQDFELGEVTLPLIYMFQTLPEEEVNDMWATHSEPETLLKVQQKLQETDAYAKQTKEKGIELLQKCQGYVNTLTDSVYKNRLSELISYTKERGFRSIS